MYIVLYCTALDGASKSSHSRYAACARACGRLCQQAPPLCTTNLYSCLMTTCIFIDLETQTCGMHQALQEASRRCISSSLAPARSLASAAGSLPCTKPSPWVGQVVNAASACGCRQCNGRQAGTPLVAPCCAVHPATLGSACGLNCRCNCWKSGSSCNPDRCLRTCLIWSRLEGPPLRRHPPRSLFINQKPCNRSKRSFASAPAAHTGCTYSTAAGQGPWHSRAARCSWRGAGGQGGVGPQSVAVRQHTSGTAASSGFTKAAVQEPARLHVHAGQGASSVCRAGCLQRVQGRAPAAHPPSRRGPPGAPTGGRRWCTAGRCT